MSREKTKDEVKREFILSIRQSVKIWSKADMPCEQKLEGLAHSILATLDGVSNDVCGFIVAPSPHKDDAYYNIENGENYYPQNHYSDVECDIAGDLHDLFYHLKE